MKKAEMKTYSLEEITDKHIVKRGTPKREAFEYELCLDLLGEAIAPAWLTPVGQGSQAGLIHSRKILNGSCTWTLVIAEATAAKARICRQFKSCTLIRQLPELKVQDAARMLRRVTLTKLYCRTFICKLALQMIKNLTINYLDNLLFPSQFSFIQKNDAIILKKTNILPNFIRQFKFE